MDYKQKILSFVRMKGPVLPTQISKEVGQNTMIASAMLSELVAKGELKFSHTKVGSSNDYWRQAL